MSDGILGDGLEDGNDSNSEANELLFFIEKNNLDVHYVNELVDRCHIINSMIDDFAIDHPATDEKMKKMLEEAQGAISSVMQRSVKYAELMEK